MTQKIQKFDTRSILNTVLHISIWSFIIFVPILFDSEANNKIMNQSEPPQSLKYLFLILMMCVFYLNYSFLVPKVLYKQGVLRYVLSLILIFLIFDFLLFFLKTVLNINLPLPLGLSLLVSLPPFIFINTLSLAIKVTSDRFKETEQSQERENETLRSELSFLRSQVSPHFLFNIMNNVVSMSRLKPHLVEPTLIQLSQLLRYMLYESNNSKVSIEKEVEYLESYIALQKMRFGESIKVSFEKELPLKFENYSIEPMLLIPFVENAFKHGVTNIAQPFIDIKLRITENHCTLEVVNKFNEVVNEIKDLDSGIGLKNVRRRLELVYNKNHTLVAQSEGGLYVVNLKLNLKNELHNS